MADEETPQTPATGDKPEVKPETPETPTTPPADELDAAALKAQLDGAQKRIHELNQENEKRRLAEKTAAEQKLIDEGKSKELAEAAQAERDAAIAERDAAGGQSQKGQRPSISRCEIADRKMA